MSINSGSSKPRPLFLNHFSNLEAPRRTTKGNFLHSMDDLLFLVLSGVLCGADDWETIILFGNNQIDWLKKYGGYKNGIPCSDTLKKVFSAIDPVQFNSCFMDWISGICTLADKEVIAIDGKTIKRTKEDKLPHIVSAFACENGLTLGQVKINDKSNEITAIPELLKLLDINGTTVTIVAMGCQRDIAKEIIAKDAAYILAIKGNQKTLEQDILDTILLESTNETHTEDDIGHGRIERRTCSVYTKLSHIEDQKKWIGIKTIATIQTEVTNKTTGKISEEQRIYISSLPPDAKNINNSVRKHWSVENNLHWTLDVLFGEDKSRKRRGNVAENYNIVMKTVLALLVKEKTLKKSKKKKEY